VRAPGLDAPALALERGQAAVVGDRCFALDVEADGTRVLADGRINGTSDHPKAGPRLSLSMFIDRGGIGGPLFDDYGSAIAVVGGTLVPGAGALADRRGWQDQMSLARIAAVPLSAITVPEKAGAMPARLPDLLARGEVVPLLTATGDYAEGLFARAIVKGPGGAVPRDTGREFRASDGEISVLTTWHAQTKRKGTATFKLYDVENKLLAAAPPTKISHKPGERTELAWRISVAGLPSGVYRLDLVADAEPIWRAGFRIVD